MSLSTDQSDPERVEYHDWLLRIQDQQLREELLDICDAARIWGGPRATEHTKMPPYKEAGLRNE